MGPKTVCACCGKGPVADHRNRLNTGLVPHENWLALKLPTDYAKQCNICYNKNAEARRASEVQRATRTTGLCIGGPLRPRAAPLDEVGGLKRDAKSMPRSLEEEDSDGSGSSSSRKSSSSSRKSSSSTSTNSGVGSSSTSSSSSTNSSSNSGSSSDNSAEEMSVSRPWNFRGQQDPQVLKEELKRRAASKPRMRNQKELLSHAQSKLETVGFGRGRGRPTDMSPDVLKLRKLLMEEIVENGKLRDKLDYYEKADDAWTTHGGPPLVRLAADSAFGGKVPASHIQMQETGQMFQNSTAETKNGYRYLKTTLNNAAIALGERSGGRALDTLNGGGGDIPNSISKPGPEAAKRHVKSLIADPNWKEGPSEQSILWHLAQTERGTGKTYTPAEPLVVSIAGDGTDIDAVLESELHNGKLHFEGDVYEGKDDTELEKLRCDTEKIRILLCKGAKSKLSASAIDSHPLTPTLRLVPSETARRFGRHGRLAQPGPGLGSARSQRSANPQY